MHDRGLESLKDSYARGVIGLDTFETQVADFLAAPQPVKRRTGLLAALLDERTVAYLGRSSACHLVLANDTVSRRHAMLSVRGRDVVLIDLDSTNGTLVNGRPVRSAEVRDGDRVTLGEVEIEL